jgi:flagellar basal body-associated protein FliL
MFKFILTLLLIVLVLRALARLFMPFMVTEVMKKAQRNMQDQYRRQQPTQREGEIYVDYAPPKPKKKFSFTKTDGDFVDYEEIKK